MKALVGDYINSKSGLQAQSFQLQLHAKELLTGTQLNITAWMSLAVLRILKTTL